MSIETLQQSAYITADHDGFINVVEIIFDDIEIYYEQSLQMPGS